MQSTGRKGLDVVPVCFEPLPDTKSIYKETLLFRLFVLLLSEPCE